MAQYRVRITEELTRTGTMTIEAATMEAAADRIEDMLMGDGIAGDLDTPGQWDDQFSTLKIEEIIDEDGTVFVDTNALLASAEQEA